MGNTTFFSPLGSGVLFRSALMEQALSQLDGHQLAKLVVESRPPQPAAPALGSRDSPPPGPAPTVGRSNRPRSGIIRLGSISGRRGRIAILILFLAQRHAPRF